MLDASEAHELIDEAVERAERRDAAAARAERQFRDRLSLLVGVFAALLAVVHLIGAGYLRENVVDTIRASDTYNYMQAKKIRQAVLETGALTAPASERAQLLAAAAALKAPDAKGHGIDQLQKTADALAAQAVSAGEAGERYEWAETALQMAIVLMSIAMIAASRVVVAGATGVALLGVGLALATYFHLIV